LKSRWDRGDSATDGPNIKYNHEKKRYCWSDHEPYITFWEGIENMKKFNKLADGLEEGFVNGDVAYIPRVAEFTNGLKGIPEQWKTMFRSSYYYIGCAKTAVYRAEKAHKKCTKHAKYSIEKNEKFQRQITRAWRDAGALFPDPKKLEVGLDLADISETIKQNDLNKIDTDFYKLYKECSKARGSGNYNAYLNNPLFKYLPDALKRELKPIKT